MSKEFAPGDQVLVTGYDGGATRWGGWAEFIRVPHDWIVPLPEGLTLRETMILGTAGLTAALCVDALQKHDIQPGSGPVVVTGATGGVGGVAVAILGKLGYTCRRDRQSRGPRVFERLGADADFAREEVDDRSGRPLLSGRWAGGVDTVGGNILGTLLRSLRHGGCVAACGLAGSNELPVTVYPFILRAVTLTGIDAAWCPLSASGGLASNGRGLETGKPGIDGPLHNLVRDRAVHHRHPCRADSRKGRCGTPGRGEHEHHFEFLHRLIATTPSGLEFLDRLAAQSPRVLHHLGTLMTAGERAGCCMPAVQNAAIAVGGAEVSLRAPQAEIRRHPQSGFGIFRARPSPSSSSPASC